MDKDQKRDMLNTYDRTLETKKKSGPLPQKANTHKATYRMFRPIDLPKIDVNLVEKTVRYECKECLEIIPQPTEEPIICPKCEYEYLGTLDKLHDLSVFSEPIRSAVDPGVIVPKDKSFADLINWADGKEKY